MKRIPTKSKTKKKSIRMKIIELKSMEINRIQVKNIAPMKENMPMRFGKNKCLTNKQKWKSYFKKCEGLKIE